MPEPLTILLNPPDLTPRHALETLDAIQRYVGTTQSFRFSSLAKGLLRTGDEEALTGELCWLIQNGYVTGQISGLMQLTQKGRSFEQASENDAADDE